MVLFNQLFVIFLISYFYCILSYTLGLFNYFLFCTLRTSFNNYKFYTFSFYWEGPTPVSAL
jgi:hypothetical protein